jgi:hypothetical protein
VLVQQGGRDYELTERLALLDPLVLGDQLLRDLHFQDGVAVHAFVASERHIGDPHTFPFLVRQVRTATVLEPVGEDRLSVGRAMVEVHERRLS